MDNRQWQFLNRQFCLVDICIRNLNRHFCIADRCIRHSNRQFCIPDRCIRNLNRHFCIADRCIRHLNRHFYLVDFDSTAIWIDVSALQINLFAIWINVSAFWFIKQTDFLEGGRGGGKHCHCLRDFQFLRKSSSQLQFKKNSGSSRKNFCRITEILETPECLFLRHC